MRDSIPENINRILSYLDDTLRNFNSKRNELIDVVTDFENEHHERFVDEYFNNGMYFPRLLKNSCLITLYSFFEDTLKKFVEIGLKMNANEIDLKEKIRKEKKKIKGSDIYRFKMILINNVGLDLSKAEETYMKIEKFREVRNAIVHSQGNIDSIDVKLKIIHSKHIKISSELEILIDQKYLIEFSKLIEEYLLNILSLSVKKYREHSLQ
jgi:hypothetical protein